MGFQSFLQSLRMRACCLVGCNNGHHDRIQSAYWRIDEALIDCFEGVVDGCICRRAARSDGNCTTQDRGNIRFCWSKGIHRYSASSMTPSLLEVMISKLGMGDYLRWHRFGFETQRGRCSRAWQIGTGSLALRLSCMLLMQSRTGVHFCLFLCFLGAEVQVGALSRQALSSLRSMHMPQSQQQPHSHHPLVGHSWNSSTETIFTGQFVPWN